MGVRESFLEGVTPERRSGLAGSSGVRRWVGEVAGSGGSACKGPEVGES